MELHKTQRGKDKLVIDGYAYVKNKYLANDRISYECANRRGSGKGHKANTCIARIHVDTNGAVVKTVNEHTHGPDPTLGEVLEFEENIKQRAKDTQETAQQILTSQASILSESNVYALPKSY